MKPADHGTRLDDLRQKRRVDVRPRRKRGVGHEATDELLEHVVLGSRQPPCAACDVRLMLLQPRPSARWTRRTAVRPEHGRAQRLRILIETYEGFSRTRQPDGAGIVEWQPSDRSLYGGPPVVGILFVVPGLRMVRPHRCMSARDDAVRWVPHDRLDGAGAEVDREHVHWWTSAAMSLAIRAGSGSW